MKLPYSCAAAALYSFFLIVNPAYAQGTAFTYQGRLNDGGNSANGSYDLTFSLFNTNTGGSQIGGTLTNINVGVTNGLFIVTENFGAVFNGTPYWLQIGVRTNGGSTFTPLSPRQALTPAPYAIFANTASNVSGTISAAQLSGPVGSGNLSGTYGKALTLNNPGNSFSGNGANLTNVSATALNGLNASNFWQLGGNTVSAGQILGSTNNQPLELWVNNVRALRLEPGTNGQGAPNVIGGSPGNFVSNGVVRRDD